MGVSLQDGWLSWLLMVLGVAAFAFLLIRPLRWWWIYVVPAVVVVSALGGWLIGELVGPKISDKPLEGIIDFWIGVVIAGVLLAIGHQFRSPWWQKIVAVVAALLVLIGGANQMNKHFVQFPTLGDVFGVESDDNIAGPPVINSGTSPAISPTLPPGPLTQTWKPTGDNIPADGRGKTSTIDLPGTVSGFKPRQGMAYYPPAYFADNPEPLPVLILMAGQPGNPSDYFLGDRLPNIMNEFAAAHNGIAPVVVVPDPLVAETGNPLCADAWEGNAMTYLTQDVPNEIKKQLRVTQDTKTWVVGGWSSGGTCALQLATNHPEIYPNFIDISGEWEVSLGSHQQTVDQGFGGDAAKFASVNSVDLMQKNKYPQVSGWFIWGSNEGAQDVTNIYPLAKSSGMNVQEYEVQGSGHDWATVVAGLTHVMPWIAQKTGLTA